MILLNVRVKPNSENSIFFLKIRYEATKIFSRLWTRQYKVKFFYLQSGPHLKKLLNSICWVQCCSFHMNCWVIPCCLVGLNTKSFKMFVPGWFDRRVPDLLDYWFLLTVTWQTRWKTWTEISLLKIQEAF